jgi:hypothetical protein
MGRWLLLALGALPLAACELPPVPLPDGPPVLVVDAVLVADQLVQTVLLHESLQNGRARAVLGAHVVVRDSASGDSLVFLEQASAEPCLVEGLPRSLPPQPVGCYVGTRAGFFVQPGRVYRLEVRTADGRRAWGRTRVPGRFTLVSPQPGPACTVRPDSQAALVWTRADSALVYLADAELRGLEPALAPLGIQLPEPIKLLGLSAQDTDTILVVPRDLGLFQRLEYPQPLWERLARGLPAGAEARVVVAALERNVLNAIRGGAFNPSGPVRASSVGGDAVGVFGAYTRVRLTLYADAPPRRAPACRP